MTVDDVRILRDIGMSFCLNWSPSSLTLPQNNFTAHKLYVAPSVIASYCFHCWWPNPQGRNAGKCCGAYLGVTQQTTAKLLLALRWYSMVCIFVLYEVLFFASVLSCGCIPSSWLTTIPQICMVVTERPYCLWFIVCIPVALRHCSKYAEIALIRESKARVHPRSMCSHFCFNQ